MLRRLQPLPLLLRLQWLPRLPLWHSRIAQWLLALLQQALALLQSLQLLLRARAPPPVVLLGLALLTRRRPSCFSSHIWLGSTLVHLM